MKWLKTVLWFTWFKLKEIVVFLAKVVACIVVGFAIIAVLVGVWIGLGYGTAQVFPEIMEHVDYGHPLLGDYIGLGVLEIMCGLLAFLIIKGLIDFTGLWLENIHAWLTDNWDKAKIRAVKRRE